MSPARPHCCCVDADVTRLNTRHTPSPGRYATSSATPSPSKSSAIGTSPASPHALTRTPPPVSTTYHVAVDGRYTARSALPSLSNWPGTGTSPVCPHCCTTIVPLDDCSTIHCAVAG